MGKLTLAQAVLAFISLLFHKSLLGCNWKKQVGEKGTGFRQNTFQITEITKMNNSCFAKSVWSTIMSLLILSISTVRANTIGPSTQQSKVPLLDGDLN
jgi:hypothetical protein